jgi:hypothetical protein
MSTPPTSSLGNYEMTNTVQKLGWIGVGRMGGPMAERLLAAGHSVPKGRSLATIRCADTAHSSLIAVVDTL